jgi:hypothetical protein
MRKVSAPTNSSKAAEYFLDAKIGDVYGLLNHYSNSMQCHLKYLSECLDKSLTSIINDLNTSTNDLSKAIRHYEKTTIKKNILTDLKTQLN